MLQEKTGKRAAARDCKDHTCRAGPCSGDLAGRAASDSECRTWCTNSRVRHCFDSGGGSIARLYPVRAKDVELSFDDEFELGQNDADRLIQISGGAVLWQKERLLNLAIKAVPSNVKNIAWFDCDTILQRPDWAEEANRQLDKLNVIQLFSDVVDVSPEQYEKQPALHNGHTLVPGIVSRSNARELLFETNLGTVPFYHEGLAWAANRRLLDDHGFYDAGIVGGGDSLMAAAMYGRYDGSVKMFVLDAQRREHYLRWAVPFHDSVAGCVGYVPGTIYHLAHGSRENRRYEDRHASFAGFNFNPDVDLTIGANGAWHWARSRPDLENFLMNYFINRAENE